MIRELRRKKDITQEELAKLVGVGHSAVAKWEAGISKPTADKLVKIADVLGCTVDEMLREEKKEGTNDI